MIWDIIEGKLAAANLATPRVSCFREFMPPDIKTGVMMRSPLTGINIDAYMPGYHKTRLQLIVRHDDPQAGRIYADQIARTLHVEGSERYPANAERGAVEVKLFRLDQLPIFFPRLDGNGYEFSLNFDAVFVLQPQ